ncbi:hypothetical protein F511_20962 [Dorcoceras hygrometricum]|uniref:Uncharacterized protein n=1 Tax=Dorcoceras hygrometricum TaxID=472368 RepID=A0A2Z7BXL8_9LAMI|nr:hypothetical protein F511_20962 [Dorcoceras hygrometricum]
MESAVMTSALMSSQSAVGYQQMKRSKREKRRRAEESADDLALMKSSVTSSYSADGLREQSQDISRRKKRRSNEAWQTDARSSRSDEPAVKQLTFYEELSKLDVNC